MFLCTKEINYHAKFQPEMESSFVIKVFTTTPKAGEGCYGWVSQTEYSEALCASLPTEKFSHKVNILIFYLHRVYLLLIMCNEKEKAKRRSRAAMDPSRWR